MKINSNYKNLPESYLFSKIAKKVEEYTALSVWLSGLLRFRFVKKRRRLS